MALGKQSLRLVSLVAALALLARHILSFAATARHALTARAGSVLLEPAGLADALRAAPVPQITQEQVEQLRRDGVIKLRGVVNASLIGSLEPFIWDHAQEMNLLAPPWYYNGAIRALMRDGPVAALAAAALGERKIVSGDMQVWAHKGTLAERNPNERVCKYHVDERWAVGKDDVDKMITAWVAVTDAPSAIVFLKGSHKITEDVYAQCRDPGPEGKGIRPGWLHRDCVEGPLAGNLSEQLGYAALWKADAAPGDMFLFYSHLVHAGVTQKLRRTSVCIRMRGGRYATNHKPQCIRDLPFNRDRVMQLHPRSGDVDCLPWVMLPELGPSSPVLKWASEATSRARYWFELYRLHLVGRANFIQRNPNLSLPPYRGLRL